MKIFKDHKEYLSIQNRIDNDPKYRQSIIDASKESAIRTSKTGYTSLVDEFLAQSFFMTMTPKDRKNAFKKMAQIDIFKELRKNDHEQEQEENS